MDRKIMDKLKEQKVKEREKKRSRRAKGTQLTQAKQTIQRIIDKENKVKFDEAWFVTSIRVVGERFHNNFETRYRIHPLGYMGFGLEIIYAQ
jgi:hypothetical protein